MQSQEVTHAVRDGSEPVPVAGTAAREDAGGRRQLFRGGQSPRPPASPIVGVLGEDGWEGTVAGRHQDGSSFTAGVAVLRRRSSVGMPVGLLLSPSDAVGGDELRVEFHAAEAQGDRTPESGVDAMVMIDAESETQLANAEAAILAEDHGDQAPLDLLVADRYLDRHLGLRVGFFSESQPDHVAAGPACSVHVQTAEANCYVHKLVGFHRCCDVIRTMGLLWLRSHPAEQSHV
jgi:hypothetical protein